MNIFELAGWIGGVLFLLSWIVQAYETKRAGRIINTNAFFIMRASGSILSFTAAFGANSPSLMVSNFITAMIQVYFLFIQKHHLSVSVVKADLRKPLCH